MHRRILAAGFASLACLAAAAQSTPPGTVPDANPILALAGRWAGMATMTLASGPNEAFRCVVTYFPGEAGASLRQNLRCKSPNYQFEGVAHLKIAAGKVSGKWEDRINSLHGTVNGSVTPDGFLILLSGELFDAKMTVMGSACQQTMSIVLEAGLPVKSISAALRKC
jgi:hypothetical protein